MSLKKKYATTVKRSWHPRHWRWPTRSGRLVWLCLTIILVPILSWFGPDNLAVGDMSGLDTKRARETAVIYTVLDAQDMSLNRASIWNLARSIQEESEKHRFDPALVLAIIKVESQFDHRAVSPQGARGLMQIQPVAASVVTREMELPKGTIAWTLDDPVFNVKIGTAYLRHLLDMFSDLKLALIAYNWGPTKLKQTLAAKTTVPFAYANKVLLEQRSLEQRWEHHHSFPAAPADRISEVG